MSLRKARCSECGDEFYKKEKSRAKKCQNCAGKAPDKTKQLEREKKLITSSNQARTSTVKQAVDPRSKEGQAALGADVSEGDGDA